ncbi:phosphoribosylanthranilate isomerase [Paenibacillus abyssi]|uniref:N-(5'-phosphoribosyl)anthranilate isomerase n=1 Tax=Paenibacillus abyssi TaxID=1340531 RepID=A0A917FM02_9BACL|nr:phosphoribosylanthranilate isomerase [Paenibacillus abyssi]GGF88856.1 N-(5'-phosphoribosyl)anthranilate isomerase [Paenibacillus abyssi]
MNSARLKICGLMDVETVRQLNGLPIDEIGFVFAKSRRQISPQLAALLIDEVKQLVHPEGNVHRTVGVFVNATLEDLRELLAIAPLDVIQLHGDEPPELCREIKQSLQVQVWKVFSVQDGSGGRPETKAAELLEPYRGVDAVLIDTAGGGTGKTFDWTKVIAYQEAAHRLGVPLYVAGGLQPDNVSELLKIYSPDGVDVSSGVETNGKKDIAKIREFVERVKQG